MKHCNILRIDYKITALVFLVAVLLKATALYPANVADSLKNVLEDFEIADTNYVNTCLDIAWEYMYTNSDSAGFYARKAINASEQIKNDLYLTNSYNTLGVVMIVKADYSKALDNLNKALFIANKLLDTDPENKIYIKRVLVTIINIANVYYYQSRYSLAINNYLKAFELSRKIGFVSGQANCLSNIGASYIDLKNYDKALEYNYKSLELAKKSNNSYWLSQSLNNLGSTYFAIPDYDSARYYFMASMKLFQKENNEFSLIESYVNMGSVYRDLNIYDTALVYFNKALGLSEKLDYPEGLINTHFMIGQLYDSTQHYKKAIKHYKKSVELAGQTGTSKFIMTGNLALARIYSKLADYKKAFECFKTGAAVHDTIFNKEHDKRIAELETKFQTREKEEKIRLLTKQNALEKARLQNRQILFVSVIIILLLLLVAIYLAYNSFKNKQIAERSMLRQKADRRVLDAVINTEYNERKRFAGELHDAMGALLSTLKLYINEMGDSAVTETEREKLLKQSNTLLDEAIQNARTISHNIMPASIKDNGLEYSIRSFADKINASGSIRVNLTMVDLKKHYETIIELSVYRMITEMINNTLKHAGATVIDISLIEKDNTLFIAYNDNGKGFDYEKVINTKNSGLGLQNILNRIEIIGGKHTIKSTKGRGFSAFVEINL